MTPYRKRINAATQRMAEDMLIRNLAVRTIDAYTYHVDRFSKHFGKLPEVLTPYAAGLRLSEATHLTLPDIDSARMQLRIVQAKGHKWQGHGQIALPRGRRSKSCRTHKLLPPC